MMLNKREFKHKDLFLFMEEYSSEYSFLIKKNDKWYYLLNNQFVEYVDTLNHFYYTVWHLLERNSSVPDSTIFKLVYDL